MNFNFGRYLDSSVVNHLMLQDQQRSKLQYASGEPGAIPYPDNDLDRGKEALKVNSMVPLIRFFMGLELLPKNARFAGAYFNDNTCMVVEIEVPEEGVLDIARNEKTAEELRNKSYESIQNDVLLAFDSKTVVETLYNRSMGEQSSRSFLYLLNEVAPVLNTMVTRDEFDGDVKALRKVVPMGRKKVTSATPFARMKKEQKMNAQTFDKVLTNADNALRDWVLLNQQVILEVLNRLQERMPMPEVYGVDEALALPPEELTEVVEILSHEELKALIDRCQPSALVQEFMTPKAS